MLANNPFAFLVNHDETNNDTMELCDNSIEHNDTTDDGGDGKVGF